MSKYPGSHASLTPIGFALIAGIVWLTSGVLSAAEATPNKPIDLRCEYTTDPLGIDEMAPRFSWRVETEARGAAQTAYRVLVASSAERLARDEGDLWDSGRVESAQSANIAYSGKPLASRERCWWKVSIWDELHQASNSSRAASFEMALLSEDDWKAVWVNTTPSWPGRAVHYRCAFELPSAAHHARLYVTGLGYYEAFINGQKLGAAVLAPSLTDTTKRVCYETFDVTSSLHAGTNVVAALVGSGWDGRHILRAQLEVTCDDGTKVLVATGRWYGSLVTGELGPPPYWWVAAPGGIVSDSIYGGENYDARLEKPEVGWTEPDYICATIDDRGERWSGPFIADGPSGKMQAEPMEPIEVMQELPTRRLSQPGPGVYVFDFGQNHAGFARLKVHGPKGTKITLRYAEMLNEKGYVNQDNLTATLATDTYILKGAPEETWAPRFTYHGYQYVQVEGWPGTPDINSLTSMVVHSALKERAEFACSDETLNRIHEMVRWTERSNLFGMPTDCPNRNERLGWLNDLGARSEEMVYNFDAVRFLEKFITDINDTQDAQNRSITDTAPFKGGHRPADPVSVSYLLIPTLLQHHYGDARVFERHYCGFKSWVDYLTSISKDGIVYYSHWGDWSPPLTEAIPGSQQDAISAHTPAELVSTAFHFYSARLLANIAQALGYEADQKHYAKLADEIRNAFNRSFWNESVGGYGSGNEACNAIALYLGLVPAEFRPQVVASLVRAVEKADFHVTTGNLATKHLLEVLSAEGYGDIAVRIGTQKTYPSWGYMLKKGATTLLERWEYLTTPGMNSHNHPMLGSVDSWLYRWVAGLQLGDSQSPCPHFVYRPPVLAAISHARADLQTLWGTASIEWQRSSDHLQVKVRVPWNCTGTVQLPKGVAKEIPAGVYEYTVPL